MREIRERKSGDRKKTRKRRSSERREKQKCSIFEQAEGDTEQRSIPKEIALGEEYYFQSKEGKSREGKSGGSKGDTYEIHLLTSKFG